MKTGEAAVNYYFILRRQMAEAANAVETIKSAVAEQLRRQNGRAVQEEFVLLLSQYKAWEYTPRIWTLQTMITEEKRRERLGGDARVKEIRDSLVLRAR